MRAHVPFLPESIFTNAGSIDAMPPRVLAAPSRYIQGPGALAQLGRYLQLVPGTHAGILITAGGARRDGACVRRSLAVAGIASVEVLFGGECSFAEIERAVAALRSAQPAVDCLIAIGGGKCIDAGKCVAWRLGVPMVSCPSLASNDAPCSAVSVVYTPAGVTEALEFFPCNPVLVGAVSNDLLDLVSGMGDAMATWFEARTCLNNPAARSSLAARPTLAAAALGELCANTLFADGLAAIDAVTRREITPALEHVVEANTLLSGVGFESGGLAAAHAVAQGLTVLPQLPATFLHGEMVAIGLLTQLMLEQRDDEATRAAEFFAAVGLPVHLGHLSLNAAHTNEIMAVMEGASLMPFLHNEPFAVTLTQLCAAAVAADELGRGVIKRVGDEPYRRLHAGARR